MGKVELFGPVEAGEIRLIQGGSGISCSGIPASVAPPPPLPSPHDDAQQSIQATSPAGTCSMLSAHPTLHWLTWSMEGCPKPTSLAGHGHDEGDTTTSTPLNKTYGVVQGKHTQATSSQPPALHTTLNGTLQSTSTRFSLPSTLEDRQALACCEGRSAGPVSSIRDDRWC